MAGNSMEEPEKAQAGAVAPLRARDASKSELAKRTITTLGLAELDNVEVMYNILTASGYARGGQAEVYFATWRKYGDAEASIIPEGQRVAIKLTRNHLGGGVFEQPEGPLELHIADRLSQNAQRIELHLLSLLRAGGCGERIVKPLGVFRYAGEWDDDPQDRARRWYKCKPANGYVMKEYPLGSVTKLLKDICYRRVPESVGERFLNTRTMSAEYAALLGELHKMHTLPAVAMMFQDLTPGNLLVDDGPEGMRLMLADPAMVQPIELLQEKSRRSALCGTWLWGSMQTRHQRFDPTADLYGLSFIFAEIWLVAEGAAESPSDLISLLDLDRDKAQGVQFMRHLVWQVLRVHHQGTTGIKPRVQRHLPVSWLGAWLLLLGFRDYACEDDMLRGLPCLRPSEEAMLAAAQLWARIAAAAEELPPDLTEEQAQSPACADLVENMSVLLQSLTGLSHLSDAGEQEDVALAWCATNFLEQKHPLVAALRARGAKGVGPPAVAYKLQEDSWPHAVKAARDSVLHATTPADFDDLQCAYRDRMREGEKALRMLQELGQWYKGQVGKVQSGVIPAQLVQEVQLPPSIRIHLALMEPQVSPAAQCVASAQTSARPAAPAGAGVSLGHAALAAAALPPMRAAAADGHGSAASRLPQPGTPQLQQAAVVDPNTGFWAMLAQEAASQPQAFCSGQKRKSSAADMPLARGSVSPTVNNLLEKLYYPVVDPVPQLSQLAPPAAPSAQPVGTQPAPLPAACTKTALAPPAASATASTLPPDVTLLPPLSFGSSAAAVRAQPANAPPASPFSKLSLQHSPQGPGTAAGMAAAITGVWPGPASLPAPGGLASLPQARGAFSFGAAPAGVAPASPSAFPFHSTAPAGASRPGGMAAAPTGGSSWLAAPAGALPDSSGLRAPPCSALAGNSLPPWAGQPAGGSSASGPHHYSGAASPPAPCAVVGASFYGHQPTASPAAGVGTAAGSLAAAAAAGDAEAGGNPHMPSPLFGGSSAAGAGCLPFSIQYSPHQQEHSHPSCGLPASTHPSGAGPKKSKIDGNTKYARNMVPAYADALQQLLGAPGTPFELLTTHDLKVQFLQWWVGSGPKPTACGMRFCPQSTSRYVLAVMDRASPHHGLAVGAAGWPKHVAAMPHAANIVLQGLLARE